jgi:outer membrane protein assembly factor BamB
MTKSRLLRVTLILSLAQSAGCSSQVPGQATKAGADWPQFRGPGGRAISSDTGLPLKWSARENLSWKTELPGPGTSSPIVKGERIFVTCYSGYGIRSGDPGDMAKLKRHVVCLGLGDGKVLWDRAIDSKLPEEPFTNRMPNHGYASSTPAADDERVYAFFGKTGVVAFDHAGKQLWQADVGSKVHGWGSAASPILHGDLVIVNACTESESLVALDKKTGKEVWRLPGIQETWASPVLVELPEGKTELVLSAQGRVHGLDPATGKSLWTAKGLSNYVCPTPVAHDGVIYVLGDRFQPTAMAIRAGGRGDVTASHVLWRTNKAGVVSSPLYHDGHLYFAHDTLKIAYCLDARTGKVVYEERLLPESDLIYPSPVLGDGKLYYLSRDGRMFVLAAGTRFQVLVVNDRIDRGLYNASPVIADGRLLLRSDRYLYSVGNK